MTRRLYYCFALLWIWGFWWSPSALAKSGLQGVHLESTIEFQLDPKRFTPVHRPLPGEVGVEVDLPLSQAELSTLLRALPVEYKADLTPLVDGTRLTITTRQERLRSELVPPKRKRAKTPWVLRVALVTQEQRLREFADRIRLPIPFPENLDAQLELWKEAEQATFQRKVKKAKRLWQKVGEQKKIAHLAELRIAELFLITGHINEAIARLRDVSASYPRTMGAALARLTSLQLETLTGQGNPTAEQILMAAQSGHFRRFRNFANLRASFALVALNQEELALDRFPEPDFLPEIWRPNAKSLAYDALSRAIYRPLLAGLRADAIAQYQAWKSWVQRHPDRSIIERDIAQAYLSLGMSDKAIPLIRSQLEAFPDPRREARLVQLLVRGYHQKGSHEHELESLLFLLDRHPNTPGIDEDLRAFLLGRYQSQGWDFTLATANSLLSKKSPTHWKVTLLEALCEMAMAEDRPQIVVSRMEQRMAFPPEPSLRHQADYALAMARLTPSKQAASLLRNVIGKVTASELHDRLAFALAQTEGALGDHDRQNKILDELVDKGTVWGLLARAHRRSDALQTVVDTLQKRNKP